MQRPEIPILYRDEYLVAVHKPHGVLVHRNVHAGREPFLVQLLRDQLGARVYPVHRLDRPTSGLLIMGLKPEAAAILARQFAGREVRKTYIAVVRGVVPTAGVIDRPLTGASGAEQEARTEFQRLATVELPWPVGPYATARFSLVQACPRTGRTHQIRRHFAHIRHPIIGDVLRGDGRQNRFFREHFNTHRLLLASTGLDLQHPASHERLKLRCPLAEELAKLFQQLGWEMPVLTEPANADHDKI